MLNRRAFFKKYRISESNFRKSGLLWNDLAKIYQDYLMRKDHLEPVASLIAGWFRHIPESHTVRSRVKDPEHLIEKIVRCSIDDLKPCATPENYHDTVKDIIGVRILHRFKEEWDVIHDKICCIGELDGKPEAYFREGDPSWLIDACRNKGCDINIKEVGYRSIHYPVTIKIGKEKFFVEVQVRTLFEEAWGEVDHHIRYPYLQDNPRLQSYFSLCAAVSGFADELSSITRLQKQDLELESEESPEAYRRRVELADQIVAATDRLPHLVKKLEAMIKDLPK
jgi:putative GTP pyrophosphokinase